LKIPLSAGFSISLFKDMKFILGEKIEMTQLFDEKGNVKPVTLIEAGPCFITQIKTKERDGYEAIQIGFEKKKKGIKKTEKGKEYKCLREFRILDSSSKTGNVGDKIDVSIFKEGEKVKISGISKGKGFAGAVKKWGFAGRNATHGVKHEERILGSVGATDPERVFKGKKMSGRMGGERTIIKNLEIVKIEPENNLIAIKGAIPGRKGTLLEIKIVK